MKLIKSEIDLMLKYHSPGSRYSYFPSVSYWKNSVSQNGLISHLQKSYDPKQGIDLYIHIPFCESLCTFCGCNIKITKNHKEGISYVDSLEKEWNFFKENITDQEPKISSVYLGGGTPTFLSEKSLAKLFSFLFPNGPQKLKEGTVEIDPRFVTLEKLKLFKKYGIKRISIGVQDLDIDVLENVNRKQSKEKLVKVVDLAKDLDFEEIAFDLIYGLPFQSVSSLEKTFEYLLELSPDLIAFYSLANVPWQKKGQKAFGNFSPPGLEDKFALYLKGKQLLESKNYYHPGMGFFIKPEGRLGKAFEEKSLKRNMMGIYSGKSNFLLGLGVSAMSQVNDVYFQNERILEKYIFEIDKKSFAIWRNHKQSNKENITQNIYEDLIAGHNCKLPKSLIKDLPSIENWFHSFQKDEILEGSLNSFKVTKKGKDYLKNIYQTLDHHKASYI
ncbi:MAG: coproporphyrinogen-III oxidase family protein [Bdellovibrionota bacterium]|nr:coproporphyrinogen-III oxidase family protein [Bdellovibrionota bacterium]